MARGNLGSSKNQSRRKLWGCGYPRQIDIIIVPIIPPPGADSSRLSILDYSWTLSHLVATIESRPRQWDAQRRFRRAVNYVGLGLGLLLYLDTGMFLNI